MKRKQHRFSGRRRKRIDPPPPPRAAEEDRARRQLRRAQLRFGLTFLAVAAVLFSIYAFPYADHGTAQRWFEGYLRAYARLAGAVLGLFDRQVNVSGNVIAGRFSLGIVKTCDAMEANLLFLAAIAAFPARWERRLIAGVIGLVVLVVVNVVRICSLYFVGIYAPSAFELFHIELWPVLIVLVAAAEFAAWSFWMTRERGPALAEQA